VKMSDAFIEIQSLSKFLSMYKEML